MMPSDMMVSNGVLGQVELANMNRLFFRPEQAGMTKTEAAAQTLAGINPDVAIESYTMNITTLQGFDAFKASVTNADGASRVDLILSCVDNYEARMTINQVHGCLNTRPCVPVLAECCYQSLAAPHDVL